MTQLITPALIGIFITASLLVVVNNWRLAFVILAAQYLLAALLVGQIAVWQVMAVKFAVGLLVVAILLLTGRQANYGRGLPPAAPEDEAESAEPEPAPRIEFPTGFAFRVLATLMVALAAWSIATREVFALPGLPLAQNIASYALLALGLLNLGLTEEPVNTGLGLLTVLTGFEMLYAAVEPSLAIAALLAAVNFAVALAVSYLTLLRYTAAEGGESA